MLGLHVKKVTRALLDRSLGMLVAYHILPMSFIRSRRFVTLLDPLFLFRWLKLCSSWFARGDHLDLLLTKKCTRPRME